MITGKKGYIAGKIREWLEREAPQNTVLSLDLRDSAWEQTSLTKVDVIVHTAAFVHQNEKKHSYEEYEQINVELTRRLAEKAKREGVRQFVFFSTMAVYGIKPSCFRETVITADTKPNPRTFYGKTKLEAEELLYDMASDSFVVSVLRPPMIYGPGCPGNYNGLRKLTLKTPVIPKISNKKSMLYIEYLCMIVDEILLQQAGGLFFPQNPQTVCTTELAEFIVKANGQRKLCSRCVGVMVMLASIFVGRLRKAFGTEYYAQELGESIEKLMAQGGEIRHRTSKWYDTKWLSDTVYETEKR